MTERRPEVQPPGDEMTGRSLALKRGWEKAGGMGDSDRLAPLGDLPGADLRLQRVAGDWKPQVEGESPKETEKKPASRRGGQVEKAAAPTKGPPTKPFKLEIDPQMSPKDRAQVQTAIDELMKNKEAAEKFLSLQSSRTGNKILITNRFEALDESNQKKYAQTPVRGINQGSDNDSKPRVIYLNSFNSDKNLANVLIHEIGHYKWPGLGTTDPHQPEFYRLVDDCRKKLGVTPNKDVWPGIDISKAPAHDDPLGYTRPLNAR